MTMTQEDFDRWVEEGGSVSKDEEVTWIAEDTELKDEPEPETASIVVPKELVQVIQAAPSGKEILSTCVDLAVFLSQKNISYGNSFLEPVRIFSKADPLEQIKVRIDDKLNRLMHDQSFEGDDDIKDLLGYLVLYFVVKGNND